MSSRLVPIAPAPTSAPLEEHNTTAGKPFNCQSCVRKKIKCDRNQPGCSGCTKAKLACIYQAPLPRKRKRPPLDDIYDRLARYERILKENSLLPVDTADDPATLEKEVSSSADEQGALPKEHPPGKRYIDSVLLLEAGEGDLCEVDDSSQYDSRDDFSPDSVASLATYALSGGVLGRARSLIELHPTQDGAMKLWSAYVQNVDALCKILHTPTVKEMVNKVSYDPATASQNDECLLFAIYYFAVFSMSDDECLLEFSQSRSHLMSKYQSAIWQALTYASWLKSTAMPVLQSYTLLLIALRTQVDSQSFWILTGIAVRVAQRMDLHRDGEALGLPPFEVEMRRRLFWQLLPLDTFASQVSGVGMSLPPNSWDTKPPLNVNDDEISPGMTEQPIERNRATEMIFCLARLQIHNFYTRTSVKSEIAGKIQFKNPEEVERTINEVEDFIEAKFLRYCDILNPLHFLTSAMVRSATNAVRLRARMPVLVDDTRTLMDGKALSTLAIKILDTQSAVYSNPALAKFRWQTQTFFIWDALLCVLRCLADTGFYSPSELTSTWGKVAEVFSNHPELLHGRRTLHVTIGNMTMKAWRTTPLPDSAPEPAFITALHARREAEAKRQREHNASADSNATLHGYSALSDIFTNNYSAFDIEGTFALESPDWEFWDQCQFGDT
ncbi:fungal-specific transcription factor domain-containing protein [Aspergillus carlsbadensis]|nr:fungal-specific transcription factor domain-containing protein [Aspergillus carlsbadensis]